MKAVPVLALILIAAGCSFFGSEKINAVMPESYVCAESKTEILPVSSAEIKAENTTVVIPAETAPEKTEAEIAVQKEPEDKIKLMLAKMTLREKIGQLFIVPPEALLFSENAGALTALNDEIRKNYAEYPVGGFVLFSQNIAEPQQLKELNLNLKAISRLPVFIAVDEEGGRVARIASDSDFPVKKYKSAASVAVYGGKNAVLEMGRNIGQYLAEYGFNMDFAPVADVFTNPANKIIGSRAFSSDALLAAEMAEIMASGLEEANIIPVFKHFPGHGDTKEDSHKKTAVTYKTEEEMQKCEWLPFEKAQNNECIMVGHIAAEKITGDKLPAPLSEKMVTEILKKKLGFEGLIITDSLSMGAVTENYISADAVLMAFKAGCDILLMPDNLKNAFNAIEKAVNNGEITEEELNSRVYGILAFKYQNLISENE